MRMILILIIAYAMSQPCFGQPPSSTKFIEARSLLNEARRVFAQENVKEELGVLDYQLESLKKAVADFDEAYKKKFLEFRPAYRELAEDTSLGDSARLERKLKLDEEMFSGLLVLAESCTAKFNEILLPHQMATLKKLALKAELIQAAGNDRSRMLLMVAGRLGLTREQSDTFTEKTKEVSKAYLKELKELNRKYDKILFESLPKEAQEKIKELLGDKAFE